MNVPNIVYCSHNHIYDATIHKECPYCKKIAHEQKLLHESLKEYHRKEEDDMQSLREDETQLLDKNNEKAGEGETQLLYEEKKESDENETQLLHEEDKESDEGETQLLYEEKKESDESETQLLYEIDKESDEGETQLLYKENKESDEDETQLLYEENEKSNEKRVDKEETFLRNEWEKYVAGWLVCVNGNQKGESIELRGSENYICLQNGKCKSSSAAEISGELLATMKKSEKGYPFILEPGKEVVCFLNHETVTKKRVLRTYDTVALNGYKFLFVELMTQFVNWGE